ncbi:hypothetical protein [Pseudomonas sp. NPDC089569]|uniref:hypothetical protein n=1 Tax=Pseudomonas sp. NPDC089569 TaxID=3390722 RepID=UPI003D088008
MAIQTKFFVHDKTQATRAVTGPEYYEEAIKLGFREVTAEEFDAFMAKARASRPRKRKESMNA